MKTKIDFSLNHRFGVVERIIFRLVLNGYGRVSEYTTVLPIFSDSVISNAVCHLVNQQILSLNHEAAVLTLSEPIKALLVVCSDNDYEINVPADLEQDMKDGGVIFSGLSNEMIKNKELVLRELLPNVRLEFLISSLDFRIYMKEDKKDD